MGTHSDINHVQRCLTYVIYEELVHSFAIVVGWIRIR